MTRIITYKGIIRPKLRGHFLLEAGVRPISHRIRWGVPKALAFTKGWLPLFRLNDYYFIITNYYKKYLILEPPDHEASCNVTPDWFRQSPKRFIFFWRNLRSSVDDFCPSRVNHRCQRDPKIAPQTSQQHVFVFRIVLIHTFWLLNFAPVKFWQLWGFILLFWLIKIIRSLVKKNHKAFAIISPVWKDAVGRPKVKMDCKWNKLSVSLSPEILKTLKDDLKFSNTTPVQVKRKELSHFS